ncbi:hypothetical protein AHF37_00546 [Paragonimus kellicotti]|nr:hypothetical protein AHF37_00546 [Paragonimus kellicotti]
MKGEDDSTDYIEISPRELPRYEIEEQLRFYKGELDKRDELIRDLTKLTAAGPSILSARTLETKSGTTEKLEEIRTRVEKLQHTVIFFKKIGLIRDNFYVKIAENKEIIHEKNVTISELRAELESVRLENVSGIQRIEELEDLLQESTDRLTNYKNAEDQHDMILQALQKDVRLKSSKLLELKSQLLNSETNFQDKFQNLEADHKTIKSKIAEFAKLLDCNAEPDVCIAKVNLYSVCEYGIVVHCKQRYGTEVGKLQEQIELLQQELKSTTEALEASRRSEEQLLDFRALLARHLGLDCEHLSVPDYEILVQVDRLVTAHQAEVNNFITTEKALQMVHNNYRAAHEDLPHQ